MRLDRGRRDAAYLLFEVDAPIVGAWPSLYSCDRGITIVKLFT